MRGAADQRSGDDRLYCTTCKKQPETFLEIVHWQVNEVDSEGEFIRVREGDIGGPLGALQDALQNVTLGSYPYFRAPGDFGVVLVARSSDEAVLAAAADALVALLRAAGGEPEMDPSPP